MLVRTIHFTPAPNLQAQLGGAISPGMAAKANRAQQIAKSRAPRDTGKLAASIEGRLINSPKPGTISLEAKINYAKYVIHGTDAHPIGPGSKTLKFPGSGGGPVFRSKVSHPGSKKNDFLSDAIREVFD